jgi:signal peptidase I
MNEKDFSPDLSPDSSPGLSPDSSPDLSNDSGPDATKAEFQDSKPSEPAATKPRRGSWDAMMHIQVALLALTIALFVITFVVQAFRIPSGSMEDTLLVGDYLLVDKTRFGPGGHWHDVLPYRAIRRGDIVVFRYPVDPTQHFVKRVIGLPGDRIRLWRSHVYINGDLQHEPYAVFKEHFADEFRDNFPAGNRTNENIRVEWATRLRSLVHGSELTIPPGQYFVLGDNRDQSLDSRYWGFVPRENIIGRPWMIYFSIVQADDDDDDPVASTVANGKLLTIPARISHVLGDVRWRRILRLAP